jgi:precorrin-6Y C5,15-methyltransferase (decarboxylating) CbiT subunit
MPDGWFERAEGVPMTKETVRALLLSVLSPLAGARVLEIGSGSGAVTVELARAAGPGGRITSLEVSGEAFDLAARNIGRAGLSDRVALIRGKAPEDIPDGTFGAAFIGGHGRRLEEIMEACAGRLGPEGRLAVTSVTPRTTWGALECMESLGLAAGFWRVHSSWGVKAGSEWMVRGGSPVDIIWGDRRNG